MAHAGTRIRHLAAIAILMSAALPMAAPPTWAGLVAGGTDTDAGVVRVPQLADCPNPEA
ncbi:hypothetical protein [Spongiactinospora sp. 9N601]|uniref:hypothetical protein n=1 Tax=Spongiactinospora sp. 9N601 TaxID=3375149 RepID=UPI0037B9139B